MRYILTVLLIFVSAVASAQDTTPLEPVDICTEDETQAFLDSLLAIIQTPAEGGLFEQLDALQTAIESHRWKCSGMVISGEAEPGRATDVLGPFSIPDGLYRATLTTDDFIILSFEALDGNCRLSFAHTKGDASAGAEQLFESENDCEALIEVEARADWTLQFVLVKAGD